MSAGIRAGIGVMTIRELVARARDRFGPRVFAQKRLPTGAFATLSYDALAENVLSLGAALGALDVGPGGRVAIIG